MQSYKLAEGRMHEHIDVASVSSSYLLLSADRLRSRFLQKDTHKTAYSPYPSEDPSQKEAIMQKLAVT
jgi:hypothetical protein